TLRRFLVPTRILPPPSIVETERSEKPMETLEGKKAVVTGGSRGFGLGIVEALVARKARVTVVARDADSLGAVSKRLGVDVIRGDAADPATATGVLRDVRPSVLVLNAGVKPPMGPIHE